MREMRNRRVNWGRVDWVGLGVRGMDIYMYVCVWIFSLVAV
jgi:hypothetical protein